MKKSTLNITLTGEFYDIGFWRVDDEETFVRWSELAETDEYLKDPAAFEQKHNINERFKFPHTPNWGHARGADARFCDVDMSLVDENGASQRITSQYRNIFDIVDDIEYDYVDEGPASYVYDEDDVYFIFQYSRGISKRKIAGFSGSLDIEGDFDFAKLKLYVSQIESGQNIITKLTYDGEEIMNTLDPQPADHEWCYQHHDWIDVNSQYDADAYGVLDFQSVLKSAPKPKPS